MGVTLLAEMKAKLPVGAEIDLSVAQASGTVFTGCGTFEVIAVNSAPGDEDAIVFVAYRPTGVASPGALLTFISTSHTHSVDDPQWRIDAIRR